MKNLRHWQLTQDNRFPNFIAADVRMSQTSYAEDQVWRVRLGEPDNPAIALQTQYGRRVGLASIVPLWSVGETIIYQQGDYTTAPSISHFTPNLIAVQARPVPGISVEMTFIALDGITLGGIFHLTNESQQKITIRLNLFMHVIQQDEEKRIEIIRLRKEPALSPGDLGRLVPIVLLENGDVSPHSNTWVGTEISIAPGKSQTLRWVHTGGAGVADSMAHAVAWLARPWTDILKAIVQLSRQLPNVETDDATDLLVAVSATHLIRGLIRPPRRLTGPMLVTQRSPATGFSTRADGSSYLRGWRGIDPYATALVAPVMATIDPAIAQAFILDFLATQDKQTGAIPFAPGPDAEEKASLCPPILARTAWLIHERTEDTEFLKAVYPGLLAFFNRWLAQDADGDGYPEWQSERQTGFVASPIFSGQAWAQGLAIHLAETPDLLAYLICEAHTLARMATMLNKKGDVRTLRNQEDKLRRLLQQAWSNDLFVHRDRDTHRTEAPVVLLRAGAGDISHELNIDLDRPARLIVAVSGGVRHVPKAEIRVLGKSAEGATVEERLDVSAMNWFTGRGTVTTQNIFSRVERVMVNGLSRVYRIDIHTPDTTGTDLSNLLPLIVPDLPAEQAQALAKRLLDGQQYWRPNGISMVPATDAHFDPASASGGGGVWLYWNTLLGEALLALGLVKPAQDLTRRLLTAQMQALTAGGGEFGSFYHSDKPIALGERNHIAGIAPLRLFSLMIGLTIPSHERVIVEPAFAWGNTIMVRQHGVQVRRTRQTVRIRFPSGHTAELKGMTERTIVRDPSARPSQPVAISGQPELPEPGKKRENSTKRVTIKVITDDQPTD